jgi:hypothetical protein
LGVAGVAVAALVALGLGLMRDRGGGRVGPAAPPPGPAAPTLYTGMQGQRGFTAPQLAIIARSAIVNLTPQQLALYGGQLRRDGARRLYVYVNGSMSSDPRPAGWYLRSAGGGRVCAAHHPANCLMDTTGRWRDQVVASCRAGERAGADGCFLDVMGVAPLRPGYVVAGQVPVDPGTGRPFAAADYMRRMADLAAYVQRRTGHPVIANGIGNATSFSARATGLLPTMAEAERWLTAGSWRANLRMLQTFRPGMLVLCHRLGSADQARFAYASFLLAYTPGRDFFQASIGDAHSWDVFQPFYAIRLGRPLSPMRQRGRWFVRRFTNGGVAVDPATGDARITRLI